MPATSRHKQIADAVAAAIIALNLTDITSKVHVYWGMDDEAVNLPAVFVCPIGMKTYKPATNERDDHGWPISVYVCNRQSLKDDALIDAACVWRETIENEFIWQRLPGVSQVNNCEPDSVPIIDPEFLRRYQLLVSPLRLRFWTRETRG